MAFSSSASAFLTQAKHHVFLSFRGEDTRNTFLSHLYEALKGKGIGAYADFKELPRGEEISSALLEAIEKSMISVIVFSQKYATSSWCLDELSKIMECRDSRGQLVVPIFYHVNPSDIRKLKGSFEEAFVDHERNRIDKVKGWRLALTKAAGLSGWSIAGDKPEPSVIEDIVKDIVNKLDRLSKGDCEGLIGIFPRMEQIKSLLCFGGEDVRIIGIWGMPGIGKTTLAQAIYDEVRGQFESCYFLADVREKLETPAANAITLRDQLLSQLLNQHGLHIGTPRMPFFIKDRLRRKKVLLVLDDVNDWDQLEKLEICHDHFGSGSRIIITSRNKQVLTNGSVDETYKAKGLGYNDSIKLFSLRAFNQNGLVDDYKDLSNKFLEYAKGVPLALKVLGSTVCEKNKAYWESALNKLKQHSDPKIHDVLKISFDGLEDVEKKIFLDIAIFFKGCGIHSVTKILDGCYNGTAGWAITNLVDKCLLDDTRENNLGMHDLLQEMGRIIISSESRWPEECSRLWNSDDVCKMLKNGKGTKSVEGILLDLSQINHEVQLHPRAFARMPNLRIIKFYNPTLSRESGMLVPSDQGLESLPDELRYFHWENCMLKSIPSNFSPKNLVELRLSGRNFEQLWNGDQNLENLRVLDLSHCKNLIRIPSLSASKNIEQLKISGCKSLVELPSMVHLKSLRFRLLGYGLKNLKKFPELPQHIEELTLTCTAIEEIPESIGFLHQLVRLNMSGGRIHNLPSTTIQLHALRKISLQSCRNITNFPIVPENIEHLVLGYTPIKEVPSSISRLKNLASFVMYGCTRLKSLPTSICKLKSLVFLDLRGCSNLECFPEILETKRLKYLGLSKTAITELSSTIFRFVPLEGLDLSGSDIVEIPKSIKQLSNLQYLYLSNCGNLESLPELPPCLHFLVAGNCRSLKRVPQWEHAHFMEAGTFLLSHQIGNSEFLFNNCFNLDGDAVNNIVANVQLIAQCTAQVFAMKSSEVAAYNFPRYSNGFLSCFPGSKIPKTFKNRSKNSSITVKLGPACSSKRFLGFLLCIVVNFKGPHKFKVCGGRCQYLLTTERLDRLDRDPLELTHHWNWNAPFCISFDSNHVILFGSGFGREINESINNHFDEASIEFYVTACDFDSNVEHIIVQKCGVNVLYEDAVRSNDKEVASSTNYRANDEEGLDDPTTTIRPRHRRCFSSDEVEEPEPKRLK
ncbi:TMV resistance protein N-like [Durio zibethinus]|uniref:ADP-ribosyl cyclase/cyclic ADP-ribose hydrolase n=1 Tax=Durio zibethinus TaxID=66656 RepID=A0A6P6B4N0_DURZI|nr:TMV resistance protein N-like [Durio zibethinus]XP_022771870.1 TMV resistance protein N-like [Durio zibethinus]XP_022771871.1 TMV resistance protein N-like [Durio zibethinus]XP_022771872.1 TMV resistance protein N-like [Durio zibethinus]XP_022771873.1 TMV resistance protein N-like [Durio zibethinus]XP_022771874.1 TMV resistance protein N-like [Durio zibethinus]XP_022771875.1 TMV resistance protein N-like [Durio zibethinus]XP_022771876.1 TMV resistance protein N-like [Durio zibethinus]XP_